MQKRLERVQIKSGGEILRGHLFLAGTAGPYPTAVIVPGFPGNPDDVLGLGEFLSDGGVNVLIFNPRGLHASEGISTFANTMEDISSVIDWIRSQAGSYPINADQLILGGYSYGGGMALAYSAKDPTLQRLFSISGTDHAQLIRHYQHDAEFASMLEQDLSSTLAPEGPARFDIDAGLVELAENQNMYGLQENAASLADRSILMIGGWEDQNVTVDDTLLPLYRVLRLNGVQDITFLVYHDGHEFTAVRSEMSAAILDWILGKVASV
jgi:pimeloyl-ACP methyl ester carboxylesterase